MPETPEGRITLAVLSEQMTKLVQQVDRLAQSVDRLIESGNKLGQDLIVIRADLKDLPKIDTRLENVENDIENMRPWVNIWKYVAAIAAGLIVTGLVVGIIWAAIQSGGLLP